MRWMNNSGPRRPQLGPLESHLLSALCRRGDATVRELLDAGDTDAAYTTVMTTLDRLYKKGLLERMPDSAGRAFRYRLKEDEREYYRAMLGNELDRVLAAARNPSLP